VSLLCGLNFAHHRVNDSGFVPLGFSARPRLSLGARFFHHPRSPWRSAGYPVTPEQEAETARLCEHLLAHINQEDVMARQIEELLLLTCLGGFIASITYAVTLLH
jgi:hypothetical protein